MNLIIPIVPEDGIIPVVAFDVVIARTALDRIIAHTSVDSIGSGVAFNVVVSFVTLYLVGIILAVYRVGALAAIDIIFSRPAVDGVIAIHGAIDETHIGCICRAIPLQCEYHIGIVANNPIIPTITTQVICTVASYYEITLGAALDHIMPASTKI